MSPVPSFNLSGVLPPYVGLDPTIASNMSPYFATIDELVTHFNTSAERKAVLQGFLRYRQALRGLNIVGWHWLDGSFLENIEMLENRPPKDLDVVTFVVRPASVQQQNLWDAFVQANLHVFDPNQAKANFHCDAYYVDLTFGPRSVVSQARYWFGLFSHKRATGVWKGMIEAELPLLDVDSAARAALGI
jgi:hypothetical protein